MLSIVDSSSSLVEIRRLASLIPTPANYLEGIETPLGSLPGNIICFVRNGVRDLLQPAINPVQHHRYVLLIAVHGSGRICLDTGSFLIQEGQAQLIFPFQFHSYLEVQPDDICWVFITFESLSLAAIAPLRSSPPRTLGPMEIALFQEVMQCWLQPDRHRLLPLHLGLLLGRLSALGPGRTNSLAEEGGLGADLLSRVNSYILGRLDESMGLKELAQAMGQSESYLRGSFRKATGCSLGRHIRQLRIQKACNLLHSTVLSISEVGENCGFDSVYSFSRTFKMERGVSPRDYRRGMYSP